MNLKLFLAGMTCRLLAAEDLLPIDFIVKIQDCDRLAAAITNRGAKGIAVNRFSLPWHQSITLVTVLVSNSGWTLQPRWFPVDDAWGQTTIAPGETLSGSLPLLNVGVQKDALVFWSKTFYSVDGRKSGRFAGWEWIHPPSCSDGPKSTTARPAALPLEAAVQLEQKEGAGRALKITLKNPGANGIRLNRAMLPWENPRRLILIAKPGNADARASLGLPRMPAGGVVAIKPGAETSESIPLNTRFPRLNEWLESSEVTIFWSFQVPSSDGRESGRFGGSIEIPQTGK